MEGQNLRQRRFCNVRSFMAVRYAEKRISFKSENERINSNLGENSALSFGSARRRHWLTFSDDPKMYSDRND